MIAMGTRRNRVECHRWFVDVRRGEESSSWAAGWQSRLDTASVAALLYYKAVVFYAQNGRRYFTTQTKTGLVCLATLASEHLQSSENVYS